MDINSLFSSIPILNEGLGSKNGLFEFKINKNSKLFIPGCLTAGPTVDFLKIDGLTVCGINVNGVGGE